MYYYSFLLTPSQPNSNINYTQFTNEILEAVESVNDGIAFKRDGKYIEMSPTGISNQQITLTLKCKTPLGHAARSLSALTRNLTTNYSDIFSQYVFNKTLFHMTLDKQYSSYDDMNISDTDLIHGVIDLIYTHTTSTKDEADLREKTISCMKELIKPYLKNKTAD